MDEKVLHEIHSRFDYDTYKKHNVVNITLLDRLGSLSKNRIQAGGSTYEKIH